jgi:polar amino acid transport system substrate-binding protein
MLRLYAIGVLLLGVTACDLPQDAAGTSDRVRRGTMRVGIVADTPWVTDSAGKVGGIEGNFVAELGRKFGARVDWVRRPEAELLLALSRRELDLVIGGLTDALPWKQQVAFTRPYYTDTIVVAVRPGAASLGHLDGQAVAVEAGDPVAAELRKKGAVPIEVSDLKEAPSAVAAPTWQLASLGRASAGIVLQEDRHVLATPRGENAWLVQIERLLHERQSTVPTLLRSTRQ